MQNGLAENSSRIRQYSQRWAARAATARASAALARSSDIIRSLQTQQSNQ